MSQSEFKNSDRIDRLRLHMVEPEKFVLSNDDDEYYRQLTQAYQLTFDQLRESVCLKLIQEKIDGCESPFKSKRILTDCQTLFAPFLEKNKAVRRAILVEKLYAMAELAEERAVDSGNGDLNLGFEDGEVKLVNPVEAGSQKWMELARKLYMDAAKLEGIDQPENEGPPVHNFELPDLEITSDAEAHFETIRLEIGEEADDDED